ncbi:MAG TPA: DUF362 domain-containing protein [Sedimentisphaerales bacterium]|nr:DUF362 domain-containing protein [Sedimentisphaerales bacterium]
MPNPAVALIRCTDYNPEKISEAIARQFELLGGLERFVKRGDRVLLKPNCIAPRSHRHATQTDPAVIVETARLLKDFGAKPFVGDSPAWGNVFACMKALRLQEPLKELGVPVKQLHKPRTCRIGANNTGVGISSVALDADVIINLPKFKTHQQLAATFAIKNMFGCVSGKRKAIWHFLKGGREGEFCRLLIEIYRFLNPALTIIDAVTVMDGPGPIRGRARPLGWLIAGTDAMALEIICSKLVNLDPGDLPLVRAARQMGFGSVEGDDIEILGDGLPESPCTDFELPELIPIRFSFLHVCKSIGKQILLLAKSAVKKMRF